MTALLRKLPATHGDSCAAAALIARHRDEIPESFNDLLDHDGLTLDHLRTALRDLLCQHYHPADATDMDAVADETVEYLAAAALGDACDGCGQNAGRAFEPTAGRWGAHVCAECYR